MSNSEPGIIKEFRKLYEYVRLMGEHINQIHSRLDKIERNIGEVSSSHRRAITENTAEIRSLKENMVNKYELDDFIERLKASVGESLPSLPQLDKDQPQTDEVSVELDKE